MPVPLSVVIITFNEEANIARCLAAAQGVADEVLVVDSFSTDRTVEICRQFGVRVVQHAFEGYVEQKNYATAAAQYDHVLQLDADEVLTEELRQSIRAAKADWQHAGYTLARLTNYCGTWVRHGGWYPDRKLRLYDRRQGQWQGLLLHERYEVAAGQSVGSLAGDLLHYSYYSVEQHVSQLNRFTSIAAAELALRGKRRVTLFHLLLKPLWKFVHGYFFRLGLLDGFAGLCIAGISAWGVFLKFAKLRTLPAIPTAAE
ncbi:Glycosyltransferase involved in cell wall bisynthesis [Hymenobacter daecheongensis DSM 21074]|uniref:Glycosyltransferase involved in cell wall bisynthesis n=1 Tax=Hymenobacter daecheongensis DSM 21074 TaxID=1121955 RepID=A0A1M6DEK0_9BACT|nr:glycosyltransferase family 2 protein [Hymenobacter daecheongensis]SHI71767.1 Glycosyltransferase involved in cell wall bisynthesis [Hymenobacter daecheongensis DSM 21074]